MIVTTSATDWATRNETEFDYPNEQRKLAYEILEMHRLQL